MPLQTTRLLVLLPLLVSSCALTVGGGATRDEPAAPAHAAPQAENAAVEIARLELEVARVEAGTAVQKAETAVANAELDLEAERAAMASFETGREIRVREAAAGIERAKVRLEEQQAELSELESMYAAEEFAEKTKELVLARGKNQLAAAQEALAIETMKRARLEAQELPAEALARRQALGKAETDLRDARQAVDAARLRAKLGLLRAEQALRDAEKKAAEGGA